MELLNSREVCLQ